MASEMFFKFNIPIAERISSSLPLRPGHKIVSSSTIPKFFNKSTCFVTSLFPITAPPSTVL